MAKKQDKGKPIFGLKKLPIEALLKASRLEVGKLEAYVDELEYEKGRLKEQLAKVCEENAELKEQCRNLQFMMKEDRNEIAWLRNQARKEVT